jgi:hypothetical protein
MYVLISGVLILHGLAHLVGFAGPWGLASSLAPQITLLGGRMPIGALGMRVVGVFWLGGALAFTIAAVGALRHAAWWPSFAFGAAIGSLLPFCCGLLQLALTACRWENSPRIYGIGKEREEKAMRFPFAQSAFYSCEMRGMPTCNRRSAD